MLRYEHKGRATEFVIWRFGSQNGHRMLYLWQKEICISVEKTQMDEKNRLVIIKADIRNPALLLAYNRIAVLLIASRN